MIDYALTSLQPVAQQPVAPSGLLHAPGQDFVTWLAYALVLTLAACFMPTGLKDSLKALWAPAGAFLRSLCCPWLWGALFAFAVCLCVLEPWLCLWWGLWPMIEIHAQRRRLAFNGFMEPCLT